MDLDSARIKDSLNKLRAARPPIFGAESHQFVLNDPITEEEVAAFEALHAIRLPSDYRHFLTAIGNGGAGPFFGVFPLGTMDENFGITSWRENEGIIGKLDKPFPLESVWNDLSNNPSDESPELNDREFDARVEEFEGRYFNSSLVNGAIPVCHVGCANRIWLVVTGKQAGHLWLDGRAEFSGLTPLTQEDRSPTAFATWYGDWLETCLRESHHS